MRLHVVKHAACEGPGSVADWALDRGHDVAVTELEAGQPLPAPADFDLLVLMGGPMSVNDEEGFPWLRPEKALIRRALQDGKKLLGICLGAQLIASALGARVRPNAHKEIGWFRVEAAPAAAGHPLFEGFPGSLEALHWHGETFDLPEGAVWLARSEACENQAFALGRQALALQFHLEMTAASLAEMAACGSGELEEDGPYIQDAAALLGKPQALEGLRPLCWTLLDAWACP